MKAIIFDISNVLVAYNHQRTLSALAAVSAMGASDVRANVTADIGHAFEIGEIDGDEFHQLLVQRTGATRDFERFDSAFCSSMTPDPDALNYAMALQEREDTTVAVLSNTNQLHVRWLDTNVPELQQFDLVMMSNEVHLAKPDPAIFHLALELIDLPPSATYFVDDSLPNVEAARTLGMNGIVHVKWDETSPALERWLDQA